ncbi:TM0106 family RecB-like putative nuclease [Brevibacterium litoralis]|uniref:TM0106 family RecB-like putative nuclease n=1 Tax=Brevibacterium litoralis TaxID=3138935 RepID=UPI0032EC674C
MFFDTQDRLVTSAGDLTAAATCEYGFFRGFDEMLGRIPHTEREPDAMLERTAALGGEHEQRLLDEYAANGWRITTIDRPRMSDPAAVTRTVEQTRAALESDAEIVYQAVITGDDGLPFIGFADFLVRDHLVREGAPSGAWRIQDTKLARSAKVTALLQIAAYTVHLREAGFQVAEEFDLVLGDRSRSVHRVADVEPMYRLRRAALVRRIRERQGASAALGWEEDSYARCGNCTDCQEAIAGSRDMWQVHNLTAGQRAKLRAVGLRTVDDVAGWQDGDPTGGVPAGTMRRLAGQARVQIASADGPAPVVEVLDPSPIHALPVPSAGDLFFDFEGDPLWTPDGQEWGLDYLFGFVDARSTFTPLWAHDLAQEKQALGDFLDCVDSVRAAHPDMHIYHYAPYERTHLASIAQRHGAHEERVDDLLRSGVLVDLYATVSKALLVGAPSYSIKKLEPLYMRADEAREGVTNAADSVDEYARYVELRDSGRAEEAARVLQQIADYNEYDCVSTLRLRDWLLSLVADQTPAPVDDEPEFDEVVPEEDPADREPTAREIAEEEIRALEAKLEPFIGVPHDPARTPEEQAWGLARAALRYHEREEKTFWWDHFGRLAAPVDEWAGQRDVFRVEDVEIVRDWSTVGRSKLESRELRLHGSWSEGSSRKATGGYLVYEYPGPLGTGHSKGQGDAVSVSIDPEESTDTSVLVTEKVTKKSPDTYPHIPVAITPGPPPNSNLLRDAIREWVGAAAVGAPRWPENAVADVLVRRPSRLKGEAGSGGEGNSGGETGALSAVEGEDTISALVDSAKRLDRSYLAVQGPPGTGKTYLASRAIARLVTENRWRVGVVAQSHAVVDNVLETIAADGLLPAGAVGKWQGSSRKDADIHPEVRAFTKDTQLAEFREEREGAGYVMGGTAWFFTGKNVEPQEFDLLVVDEAGQYSLANTIAVSRAARNLVLFGDPQQLPQVSQGEHPEPVDESALGFLSAGHDTLPEEFGYFLHESRRMDAAVCRPVSELSYAGALRSHPTTESRVLEGVEPGLVPVPVAHSGNVTLSEEEAEAVVRIAREHLGARWTEGHRGEPGPDGTAPTREVGARDIIVVSPYNAQVVAVREALDAAGLQDVRVGTVDKFQGQQAIIAILTLAASSAVEVPRGLDFLLMRNRLNVAISRAKWKAFLVHSPALLDHLPRTPQSLAEMSAFARLVG